MWLAAETEQIKFKHFLLTEIHIKNISYRIRMMLNYVPVLCLRRFLGLTPPLLLLPLPQEVPPPQKLWSRRISPLLSPGVICSEEIIGHFYLSKLNQAKMSLTVIITHCYGHGHRNKHEQRLKQVIDSYWPGYPDLYNRKPWLPPGCLSSGWCVAGQSQGLPHHTHH